MRNETTMGAAFQSAGFLARETAFNVALARFLNNGGTIARAHELVDMAAEKMGDGGRTGSAAEAREVMPTAPRTDDDAKGRRNSADEAIVRVPASSPERNGAGHDRFADKAASGMPRPVSQSYIAAAKAGAQKIATTVLDSYKVRDGRPIGDIRIGELERLRSANAMEAAVLRQIQRLGYADPNMTVRMIVDHDTLARMIQKAAEVADAT